jgi:hypothetical protein
MTSAVLVHSLRFIAASTHNCTPFALVSELGVRRPVRSSFESHERLASPPTTAATDFKRE